MDLLSRLPDPGQKGTPFCPGLAVPVGKPGQQRFPNQDKFDVLQQYIPLPISRPSLAIYTERADSPSLGTRLSPWMQSSSTLGPVPHYRKRLICRVLFVGHTAKRRFAVCQIQNTPQTFWLTANNNFVVCQITHGKHFGSRKTTILPCAIHKDVANKLHTVKIIFCREPNARHTANK